MTRATGAVLALAAGSLAALLAPAQGAPSPCDAALDTVARAYGSFKTLKARFVHTLEAPSLNQTEVEEGTLYLAKGGKMRWEYSAPEGKLAWSDGKESFLYLPDERQVMIQPLGDSLPVRLLMGRAEPSRELRCISASKDGAVTTLALEPAASAEGIHRLSLKLDGRGLITRLSYEDALSNRISFDFTEIVLNGPIEDSLFKVPIPKGARVIRSK